MALIRQSLKSAYTFLQGLNCLEKAKSVCQATNSQTCGTIRTRRPLAKKTMNPKCKTVGDPLSAGMAGTLFALEPRIMFDGAALATGAEGVQEQAVQDQPTLDNGHQKIDADPDTDASSTFSTDKVDLFSALSRTPTSTERNEIIFIDTSVDDHYTLLNGIAPGVEAVLLDPTRDGIEEIAEILRKRSDLDAIHIVSHGDQGELRLGMGRLTLESMRNTYANELSSISQAFRPGADVLIYGCNFGEGAVGQEAARRLAELTGADVAASEDDTGHAQLGGDWDLEYTTGNIESGIIFSSDAQDNWQALMAWYDTNWNFRKEITIDSSQVPSDQTNFKLLVNLSSDAELAANARSDGFDILFTDSNGTTKLDHEIETFVSGTGELVAWVEVPTLTAASDKTIYLYYGYASATDQQNATGVWDTNYTGVWHLDESPANAVAGHDDSTGGSNDGTPQGFNGTAASTTGGTGKISGANTFDGADDSVVIPDSATWTLDQTAKYTWEMWVNPDDLSTEWTELWGQTDGSGRGVSIYAHTTSNSNLGPVTNGISVGWDESGSDKLGVHSTDNVLTPGTWHHVTVTYDGALAQASRFTIYVDGVNVTDGGDINSIGTLSGLDPTSIAIGGNPVDTPSWYDGTIDEVRVSNDIRSADWITTQYNNQNASASFITLSAPQTSNTVVVTTASDVSDGDTSSIENLIANKGADDLISLREAIIATNNTANGTSPDEIHFNIAGAGPHTITLSSALPTITQAVLIDGWSEPDFGGTPVIRIDGVSAGAGVDGLSFTGTSDGSTVRGLMITRFTRDGILIQSGADNITVVGNWIGTTGTGSTGVGNSDDGLDIRGSNAIIGGTGANDRNVITNSGDEGITIVGSGVTGHLIQGNYIGLDPDGSTGGGNTDVGLAIITGSGNTIGGTTAAARNVISKNYEGIEINTNNNTVQGNYIGTDAGGTLDRGNRSDDGVEVQGSSTGNLIGGTAAGAGNLIAFNALDGVNIANGSSNAVLGNQIHSNTGLGIDLGASGVTANDVGDGDSGANNLQNFPVLTKVISNGSQVHITGTINSTANSYFRVEFFKSTSADSTGYGEGQTYLGFANITTDGSGNGTINTLITASVATGEFVSATATKSNVTFSTFTDTSEFSANVVANGGSFQQGTGGYSGNEDTEIQEINPATSFGNNTSIAIDLDSGGGQTQGLIQFNNIFGTGPGQIPLGSTITSASLIVYVSDPSSSGAQISLHRMLVSWSEASTWNSLTGGIQTDDSEASSSADSTLGSPTTTGDFVTFTGLASTLQAWSDGGNNYGWSILSDNTNGWDFSSSENATASQRPQLLVEYSANTAPTLDNTKTPILTAENEDAGAPSGAVGTLVSDLVDFATPAGEVDNVTDHDAGALLGIAVTAADTSNGSWFYSINNGSNWNALGTVSDTSARLLTADPANTRLYFQPNANYNGTLPSAITFRAWDRTSGTNGSLADVSVNGATTAFSSATDTASLTINAVNDPASVTNLTGDTLAYTEGNGAQVIEQGNDVLVTDIDSPDFDTGSLTVSFTAGSDAAEDVLAIRDQGTGVGQIGVSGSNVTYEGTTIGTFTGGSSGVNLVITLNSNADPTAATALIKNITYENTDTDAPTTGSRTVRFTLNDGDGGATIRNTTVNVSGQNDAPVLTPAAPSLTTITEDDTNNSGDLISTIVGASITDVDTGAVEGIAITGLTSGNGTWEYDIGSGWTAVGAVANTSALLLRATDSLRFVPDGQNADSATVTYRAWDQTSGTEGTKVDVSTNGGTTAYSTATDTATITVTAVNDAPVITSDGGGPTAAFNRSENITAVTTVTATDVDVPADTLQYTKIGGADEALFNLDINTGELSFIVAPDFEVPGDADMDNVYEVTVQVSDGSGGFDTQAISVTIVDNVGTLTVDTTSDTADGDTSSIAALLADKGADGFISLREALLATNNTGNDGAADQINFNIAGAGPHTIQPGSALPSITEAVIIDGTTEPDFISSPVIEIDGTSAGNGVNGLTISGTGGGSTIRGLVIQNFHQNGLLLQGGNNVIAGNYIGLDADGTTVTGNNTSGTGIQGGIRIESANNTIGGLVVADRNVISGNTFSGISLAGAGATGNQILGNYIGTDAGGTLDRGNTQEGIEIDNANANTIGGSAAGARNVISGNDSDGIEIDNGDNNIIQGNYIGTDYTGTLDLGNSRDGIDINEDTGDGATGNLIGGTGANEGNLIFGNDLHGIEVRDSPTTNNSILGNRIFGNTLRGIELAGGTEDGFGVTANDAGDGDAGSNDLQNYPALGTADVDSPTQLTIDGTFNSTASSNFRIEFFKNSVSTGEDSSGHGEGETYLGFTNVTTDGSGNATFNLTLAVSVSAGEFITATATEDLGGGNYGSTSEFSLNTTAVAENDAPVLTPAAPSLTTITEDETSNAGDLVSALVGASITDVDTGAVEGIAITGLTSGNGTWQYDIGSGWTAVGAVSDASALLLRSTDSLRFVPDGQNADSATVTYRAWDQTSGTEGTKVDVSTNGGTTAYSTATDTATITVTAVNDAPVLTSDGGGPTATLNAAENQTSVTTVTATDVDLPPDILQYTKIGGADAGLFNLDINSGVLTFIVAPDFETPGDADTDNVYEVTVQVSDGNGGFDTQAISVTVTDVNDAPILTNNGGGPTAGVNAAENQSSVTTLTATDQDVPADTLTYSIIGGADAASFSLDPSSGLLTFILLPDFENPTDSDSNNVYEVIVQVSDGNGGFDTQSISVSITDVLEGTSQVPPLPLLQPDPPPPDSGQTPTPGPPPATNTLGEGISLPNAANYSSGPGRDLLDKLKADRFRELSNVKILPIFLRPTGFGGVHDQRESPSLVKPSLGSLFVQQLNSFSDALKETMDDTLKQRSFFTNMIQLSGIAASAGIVAWLVRGLALLAGVLATLPAWRHLDPIPVLSMDKTEKENWRRRIEAVAELEAREHQGLAKILGTSSPESVPSSLVDPSPRPTLTGKS